MINLLLNAEYLVTEVTILEVEASIFECWFSIIVIYVYWAKPNVLTWKCYPESFSDYEQTDRDVDT